MKEVKKIVVVGGGTAGWITASWFSRRWGNLIDVTVIDKYEPERVGVGEATLLSFPGVMQKMGFKVEDWMNRIDATFKAGILFPGWGREDNVIWHPFGFTSIGDKKVPMYDIWTNYQNDYDLKGLWIGASNGERIEKVPTEKLRRYKGYRNDFQLDSWERDPMVCAIMKKKVKILKAKILNDRSST